MCVNIYIHIYIYICTSTYIQASWELKSWLHWLAAKIMSDRSERARIMWLTPNQDPCNIVNMQFGFKPGRVEMWLWVKTNGISFWGRCSTHFRTYFWGDWDVHWGYGILTRGHVGKEPPPFKKTLSSHPAGAGRWAMVGTSRPALSNAWTTDLCTHKSSRIHPPSPKAKHGRES